MSVQRGMSQEDLEQERPWEAHAWLRAETLATLAEYNEQCLDMLGAQYAAVRITQAPLLVREVGPVLKRMDADSRQRAAVCPFLLFDAGFADQQRWTWVSGNYISDLRRRQPPYFTIQQTASVARRVLLFAWHLARTQGAAARALLGMTPHCVRLISVCTLSQIHEIAEAHPEWLQPRWSTRPAFWRDLLASASKADPEAMESMRLRGIQLLAADRRALTTGKA